MLEEYIEFDYVGFGSWPRFTHYPSGDTCLKKPHMLHNEWIEKRKQFLSKYPNVIILTEDKQEIFREDFGI